MAHRNGIALGDKVEDTITGFSGLVTGIADYLTGCSQACVQPRTKDSGDFQDSRWFDVDRLVTIERKAVTHIVTTAKGGPSRGAPTK